MLLVTGIPFGIFSLINKNNLKADTEDSLRTILLTFEKNQQCKQTLNL